MNSSDPLTIKRCRGATCVIQTARPGFYARREEIRRLETGCRGRTRTGDLLVMSQASCLCSTLTGGRSIRSRQRCSGTLTRRGACGKAVDTQCLHFQAVQECASGPSFRNAIVFPTPNGRKIHTRHVSQLGLSEVESLSNGWNI